MDTTSPQPGGSGEQVEIERKYLLNGMPVLPRELKVEIWRIEQGYLQPAKGAAEALARGRLRRTRHEDGFIRHYHTVKDGVGLVRTETEREINAREFEANWPRTMGRRLKKVRYRLNVGELLWEIDEFDGIDLVLAEVELPKADHAVEIPAWLKPHVVREVTDDPVYTNASIAFRLIGSRLPDFNA